MMKVTIEQSRKRFRSLPKILQDAIFSIQTGETIRRIAEQNHLIADKIPGVAEATGLVLLGFIHPEEAAREIRERSGIDLQVAQAIASSLSARIFSPLQREIDLAYAPLPEEHHEPEPVILEKPSRVVEEIQELKESGSELVDILKKRGGVAPVGPSGLKRPVSSPKPMPFFDNIPKPPPPLSPPPPSPRVPSAQGPVMIHKESEATPLGPKKDFRLEWPEDKLKEGGSGGFLERQDFSRQTDESLPAAKLEIGGMRKIPQGPAKTEVAGPKVVHYKFQGSPVPSPGSFSEPKFKAPAPIDKIGPRLPITESEEKKPQWLDKIINTAKPPESRPVPQPGMGPVREVNYGISAPPPPAQGPRLRPGATDGQAGGPPPNLPVSSREVKSGGEVIDLGTLQKIKRDPPGHSS